MIFGIKEKLVILKWIEFFFLAISTNIPQRLVLRLFIHFPRTSQHSKAGDVFYHFYQESWGLSRWTQNRWSACFLQMFPLVSVMYRSHAGCLELHTYLMGFISNISQDVSTETKHQDLLVWQRSQQLNLSLCTMNSEAEVSHMGRGRMEFMVRKSCPVLLFPSRLLF